MRCQATGHILPARIFVSGPDPHDPPTATLIAALRARGAQVDHSPASGDDPGFREWYGDGLVRAVAGCDRCVLVPVLWWDSSTWMGIEADAAYERSRSDASFQIYVWRPTRDAPLVASGMRRYVGGAIALPAEADEAATALLDGR